MPGFTVGRRALCPDGTASASIESGHKAFPAVSWRANSSVSSRSGRSHAKAALRRASGKDAIRACTSCAASEAVMACQAAKGKGTGVFWPVVSIGATFMVSIEPIVKFRGVSKRYGDGPVVLDGIDLEIA